MNKPFYPSTQQSFLEQLTELAREMNCSGEISGYPPLPPGKKRLSLEEILWIQVMMRDLERAKLTLQLGADVDYSVKKKSLHDLAEAYREKDLVRELEKYGAKSAKKHKPKKSATT